MIKALYGTLLKAKQIILSIYERLDNVTVGAEESKQSMDDSGRGVNEEGDSYIEGSTLGKRQRLTMWDIEITFIKS